MLPGRPSLRSIVLAAAVPFAGLMALALLDLASGGNGHFTRSILRADSPTALLDVVERRYALAYDILTRGVMPLLTLVTLLAVAYAVRHRERVFAPLRGSPSWQAALVGGLAGSVAGALTNDSGPMLFVFGVFLLGCATAYLRAAPQTAAGVQREDRDRRAGADRPARAGGPGIERRTAG